MSGATTIIAVVALLIGLAAIWLVTESIKKIEQRTQKMLEVHLRGLRQTVKELGTTVRDMKAGQEDIRNRVRDVVRNRETGDVEISSLRRELDMLNKAISETSGKSGKSRAGRM